MKTASQDIFYLIKSLTKSEKRYFKLSSELQDGKKLYIKLFDEICNQKTYDEAKIILALKLNKQKKWFSFLKMRLYNSIMRSLENYNYDNYAASEIRNRLNRYDILFGKGLHQQCLNVLKKAKSTATRYEFFHLLAEIHDKEYYIYNILSKKPDVLSDTITRSEKAFEEVKNERNYFYLFENLHTAYNTYGVTRNQKEYKLMKDIFNNPLVKTEKEPEAFMAKDNYFLIHTFKNYFEQKFEKMHYYAKRRADAYIHNPLLRKQYSGGYIKSLQNVLISCFHSDNVASSEYYLKKMDEAYSMLSSAYDKKQAFISSLWVLKYYFQIKNYTKANTKVQSIINELPNYEDTLGLYEKTDFYANIFLTFFYNTDYRKAIFWLNKIRNFEVTKMHKEYLLNIHPIIYLITHYEAGSDKDFLNSLLKSTHKKIKRTSVVFKFENIFKSFFAEYLLPESMPEETLYKAFLKLKGTLNKLSKDPVEKRVFLYFDFAYWVDLNIDKYSGKN